MVGVTGLVRKVIVYFIFSYTCIHILIPPSIIDLIISLFARWVEVC